MNISRRLRERGVRRGREKGACESATGLYLDISISRGEVGRLILFDGGDTRLSRNYVGRRSIAARYNCRSFDNILIAADGTDIDD